MKTENPGFTGKLSYWCAACVCICKQHYSNKHQNLLNSSAILNIFRWNATKTKPTASDILRENKHQTLIIKWVKILHQPWHWHLHVHLQEFPGTPLRAWMLRHSAVVSTIAQHNTH